MSAEFAAHVINSGMTTTDENGKEIPVPFIGPKKSVETWIGWGVPEDRCITVKPGDVIKIKDLETVALDSFGLNPVGIQDKMETTDILRMAEALDCKVVIPIHDDVWTNFMADITHILLIRTDLHIITTEDSTIASIMSRMFRSDQYCNMRIRGRYTC